MSKDKKRSYEDFKQRYNIEDGSITDLMAMCAWYDGYISALEDKVDEGLEGMDELRKLWGGGTQGDA